MYTHKGQSAHRPTIESLIAALGSPDGLTRMDARIRLAERGPMAVDGLIRSLRHPQERVRWEAAKALATIADPEAASALADALSDPEGDVRWLAAEGLINIGRVSIEPVLELLTQKAGSTEFREAAHHVLHTHFNGVTDDLLVPVLEALDGPSPQTAVPIAAYRVLADIQGVDRSRDQASR